MRNKYILLLTFFITCSLLHSKDIKKEHAKKDNKTNHLKIDSIPNLSINEKIKHTGEIHLKSDNQSVFEILLPSVVALFIGGITVISTMITSKRQLKSNKEALEIQKQSSLEIANLDFKINVLSNNRQNWINELRECASELISLINLNKLDSSNVSKEDSKRIKFVILKMEFMLNPVNDLNYITALKKLNSLLFDLSSSNITDSQAEILINDVVDKTKITLKTEWERVKSGQ